MFSEKNAAAGVTFPKGFKAAGVKAGIKKSGNLDLALIYTARLHFSSSYPGRLQKRQHK